MNDFWKVILSSVASLAVGAIGGTFGTVRVYGADVAALRSRQTQHCERVKIERVVMLQVTEDLVSMVGEVCESTGQCTRRAFDREKFKFPEEQCEESKAR